MTALKNSLKDHRIEAGLSQADLATRVGISRQAYASLESGKSNPSTVVCLRLAQTLGVPVEAIFSLSDVPSQPLHAQLVASEEQAGLADATGYPKRVKLMEVGDRLLARPLPDSLGTRFSLVEADGVILPGSRPSGGGLPDVEVSPFDAGELKLPCLSLLGCDPAMALLEPGLRQRGVRFIWQEENSYQALAGLARGEAHVAGCHLRDSDTGGYNVSWTLGLLAFPFTLVTFADWQQGLMVARGNPKRITGPEHLARQDVSIVNRPGGSGSRDLLDRLLDYQGIPKEQVRGYDKELKGHLDVAAAVSSRTADAGIGIEAAAAALGLDFLPLEEERFDLAIPNHFLDSPGVQALLELLNLPVLGRRVEALPGYDVSRMGSTVSLS